LEQARVAARADVFDCIERFYNPRRRHSTLELVSPDQFEKPNQAVRETGAMPDYDSNARSDTDF